MEWLFRIGRWPHSVQFKQCWLFFLVKRKFWGGKKWYWCRKLDTVFVSFNQCSLCSYVLLLLKSWISTVCVPSVLDIWFEIKYSIIWDNVPKLSFIALPFVSCQQLSWQCPCSSATSWGYVGLTSNWTPDLRVILEEACVAVFWPNEIDKNKRERNPS